MAKARLLYHQKFGFPDGAVQEILIWQLPEKTLERLHGLKYSLYYGLADGTCLIRYDNELGKGDHRHIYGKEEPYNFTDRRALVEDFLDDIRRVRGEKL